MTPIRLKACWGVQKGAGRRQMSILAAEGPGRCLEPERSLREPGTVCEGGHFQQAPG